MRPPKHKQSALRAPLNRLFGAEANVRILRAASLEPFPMSRTELGRVADLGAKGAYLAANRLLEEGVLRLVGKGTRQQVELSANHPLAGAIQALFRAEQASGEELIASLKRVVRAQSSDLIAAWIQGPFAKGEDRPGDPIVLGVLGSSKALSAVLKRLRKDLSKVEASHDTTVELVGYTRPDLAVAKPAERRRLSDAMPLFGLPPSALRPHSEDEYYKLRNAVVHGDRDKEHLVFAHFIADRILRDPTRLRAAKDFLTKRLEVASEHERYALEEWTAILDDMSTTRLRRFLLDEGERATRLRQTLPFLDILTPKEREELLHMARRK